MASSVLPLCRWLAEAHALEERVVVRRGWLQLEPLQLIDGLSREVDVRRPAQPSGRGAGVGPHHQNGEGWQLLHRAIARHHAERLGELPAVGSDTIAEECVSERLAMKGGAGED